MGGLGRSSPASRPSPGSCRYSRPTRTPDAHHERPPPSPWSPERRSSRKQLARAVQRDFAPIAGRQAGPACHAPSLQRPGAAADRHAFNVLFGTRIRLQPGPIRRPREPRARTRGRARLHAQQDRLHVLRRLGRGQLRGNQRQPRRPRPGENEQTAGTTGRRRPIGLDCRATSVIGAVQKQSPSTCSASRLRNDATESDRAVREPTWAG